MLKARQRSTRWWALTTLTCLTGVGVATLMLVTSGSPQVGLQPGPCPFSINNPPTGFGVFPLPEVRQSLNGLLRTSLTACIATTLMQDQRFSVNNPVPPAQPVAPQPVQFNHPSFEGAITAPTLSVKPGDTLSILMVNRLPPNPAVQRDMAFPHDPNSVNFHSHGLLVSPLGQSDNIFREMNPGTAHNIQINIPQSHPSGTYWYHVHKHGSATYQFLGGMAGFLIVNGGAGTLDAVPEVAAAKNVPMAFQIVRSLEDGSVVFVNEQAEQFGTFPFPPAVPPTVGGFEGPGPTIAQQGLWSTYGLDGGLQPNGQQSRFSYTTNGVVNPTLLMQPGEVQRWRLLNATDAETFQLVLVLKDHPQQGFPTGLNVVAMDGITVPKTYHIAATAPIIPPPPGPGQLQQTVAADALVMGSGQRMDVMVKAPTTPGTYYLQTIDPNSSLVRASVSPYRDPSNPNLAFGIDPAWRMSRRSFDFPIPCPGGQQYIPQCGPGVPFEYPITLATIVVNGLPVNMNLPADPLPVPTGLPSMATMQNTMPNKVRQIGFVLCGGVTGTQNITGDGSLGNFKQFVSPAACGWYMAKYDANYWGGAPFTTLLMMRDLDDTGQPSNPFNPDMPLVNFKKDALFNPLEPLFPDMIAGNYEEWTIYNRSFSDHPWHLHQNHVLVTKINGFTLPLPEWHDTLLVPAAYCPQGTSPPPTPVGAPRGQRRGGPGAGRSLAAVPAQPLGPNDPTNTCWGSGSAAVPGPGGFSGKINDATPGTITFRVYFNPITVGCFVAHCHIIDHEDLGMMQRLDILPAPGQSSGCQLDVAVTPDLRKRLALRSSFEICSSTPASRFTPVTDLGATAASIASQLNDPPRWNLLDNVLRPIFRGSGSVLR
jgi:FtsP/CotA-like multicopper oxidase with cupredoxin domain